MKYAIAVIAAAALVVGISTCSHECYPDLQQLIRRQVELVRDCGEDVARARNPGDVVFVIDSFSASMEKLSPQVRRLRGKYPELLRHISRREFPDALEKTMLEIKELDPILFKANAKLMQFSGNPAVEAARTKWETAMGTASWRQSETP